MEGVNGQSLCPVLMSDKEKHEPEEILICPPDELASQKTQNSLNEPGVKVYEIEVTIEDADTEMNMGNTNAEVKMGSGDSELKIEDAGSEMNMGNANAEVKMGSGDSELTIEDAGSEMNMGNTNAEVKMGSDDSGLKMEDAGSEVKKGDAFVVQNSTCPVEHSAVKRKSAMAHVPQKKVLTERDIIVTLLQAQSSWVSGQISEIIIRGRPTPKICRSVLSGACRRNFRIEWYESYKWMAGSSERDSLYCWPCLLFSQNPSIWTKEGFSDWRHLCTRAAQHASTTEHINSDVALKRAKNELNGSRVERNTSDEEQLNFNAKVRENREALKRLVLATVLTCRQVGLPQSNAGIELPIKTHSLECFEYLLKHIWEINTGHSLSGDIQNELIECVAEELASMRDNEIKGSKFFACTLEKASDAPSQRDLSVILRYVDNQGCIRERFMGYKNIGEERNATAVNTLVQSVLKDFDWKNKLIAVSFDGAAIDVEEMESTVTLIKSEAPLALVVHSHTHGLNEVLQQGVQSINKTRGFFATIDCLSLYLRKSAECAHMLNGDDLKDSANKTAGCSPISQVLKAIVVHKATLIEIFQNIIDGRDSDPESKLKAMAFLSQLNDLCFVFLTIVFSNIFNVTDSLHFMLGNGPTDILGCNEQVKTTIFKLGELQNQDHFLKVFCKAARTTDIKIDVSVYLGLYNQIFDNITRHLLCRFSDLKSLSFLDLAKFSVLKSFDRNCPDKALASLFNSYKKLFDPLCLKNELSVLSNSLFKDANLKRGWVTQILQYMKKNEIHEVVKNAHRLFSLMATFPTVATSSDLRSPSAKNIVIPQGSTDKREHFSALRLFSSEKDLLAKLERQSHWPDSVIDRYASKKPRQIDLIFKS